MLGEVMSVFSHGMLLCFPSFFLSKPVVFSPVKPEISLCRHDPLLEWESCSCSFRFLQLSLSVRLYHWHRILQKSLNCGQESYILQGDMLQIWKRRWQALTSIAHGNKRNRGCNVSGKPSGWCKDREAICFIQQSNDVRDCSRATKRVLDFSWLWSSTIWLRRLSL